MDIKKLNIPTLDGPNWGQYSIHLQAAARILDIWEVIRGEIATPAPNLTYDLLIKPVHPGAQATAAKTIWNKKNAQALGLMQTTISPVIWQCYIHHSTAKYLWDTLETEFGRAGGALTYLQMVNMVKIQFTNLMELLLQIQQFQDNCNMIMLNGHSRLSEDLATFMFCSSLPESYELTAWQYLDNIMVIANYKLTDIIAQVLQEESRRKAQAIGQGSSLNKFSTVKNLGQKCAKCGKTNHSTQNHWPGGKHPNKGEGQKSQKTSGSSGKKKKADKKGKDKEKAQTSANILDIVDIGELSITSSESINFSCYKMSEMVEWFLDSGCTDHITPRKSDFVQYRELGQLHKAEITNRKYLRIEGFGMIIRHSIMPHGCESLQIQNMLYVPEVKKRLFSLSAAGQHGSMSQTMKESTTVSQNGTPFIIGTPKSGKLHSFDMVLAKNQEEVPKVITAMLSDYTLWHRRMGDTHQCIIKHLGKNTEGGPHQTTNAPHGACEGCEKGKSKRLPFPTLRSRVK